MFIITCKLLLRQCNDRMMYWPQVTMQRYGQKAELDNRWVVPYNATALLLFNCHINVEVTTSIKCIKYLTMYIEKGPDMIEVCTGWCCT